MNIYNDDFEVSNNTVQCVMDLLDTSEDKLEAMWKELRPCKRPNSKENFDVDATCHRPQYLFYDPCTALIHFAVATAYLKTSTTVYMILLRTARIALYKSKTE